jgi:hypothetical protein
MAQLGFRVGRLGPQCRLGLLPHRRGPVPEPGAAQDIALEALAALAQLRGCLEAVGKPGDPFFELMAGLVVGIGGHGHQPVAQAGEQAVEDPPVNRVGHPAGRLSLEQLAKLQVMVGEVAVGGGHDGVEQIRVVASRDDDAQGTPGQRRYLDGAQGPVQFGGEHALGRLIHRVTRASRRPSTHPKPIQRAAAGYPWLVTPDRKASWWRVPCTPGLLLAAMRAQMRGCHAGPMGLRCLIVDDSPGFLQAARALLEQEGMTVVGIASTSEAAIQLIGLNDRVEALGGTVRIDSPAGKGTSLFVTLPIAGD